MRDGGAPRGGLHSHSGAGREVTWPALVLVAGLALVSWSLLNMRLIPPEQDPVLVASVADYQVNPAPLAAIDPPDEPEKPAILYPVRPEVGDKIGTITLPTLGLSWPVYEGTDEDQLALGVGHFQSSVLPGIRDNSVLSGHRTTVFGSLGDLEVGDLIIVGTSAGEFTYQVREFRIVIRTSRDVIVPTETAVLTLTTCYPFDSLVRTTKAFIVSADLIDSRLNDQ